jgi:hypothetical protein
MRLAAIATLVCCSFAIPFVPSARADFLLNCRLLDTNRVIWKQHCRAQTPARVRCRDRFECLVLKKLVLSQGGTVQNLEGVVARLAPSMGQAVGSTTGALGTAVQGSASALGGTISTAGHTLGGTVEGATNSVGGALGGVSSAGSDIVSSTGSGLDGSISGATNTVGDTITSAGNTVGGAVSGVSGALNR